jgi:glucose-1-phosphate adenylyltransferase
MQDGNAMNSFLSNKKTGRDTQNTLAIILAGGSGSRLKSLTQWHSKPAIPFGGKFRTIDFSLSNCLNSDIRRISVLTQYKSHSLNAHIQKGWNFLRPELGEYIDCIPAQQRTKGSWYQGTADAVFQNLDIIQEQKPNYVVVLAGDHVYKMDYRDMLSEHINKGADMSVACLEVSKKEATQYGVMKVDKNNWIQNFVEKPACPECITDKPDLFMASMGIYIFSTQFLYRKLLEDSQNEHSSHDFGKDIIPNNISDAKISAFPFRDKETGKKGYWRDVGTIDSYYKANMDLVEVSPLLNLYDEVWPVWTYQEQLPPAKFVFNNIHRRGMALDSIVSSGCIISGANVEHSLLSSNVRVHSFSNISKCVILPDVEIGRHCILRNCIIDQGCKVPDNSFIGVNPADDGLRFLISEDGVVLVSKEMLVQDIVNVA